MKTLIVIRAFVPGTTVSTSSDLIAKIVDTVSRNHGTVERVTIEGPYPDNYGDQPNVTGPDHPEDQDRRMERRRAPGPDAKPEGRSAAREAADAFADPASPGGEPAEPAKRGRGRPRKEAGPTGEDGGGNTERPARREAAERDEPVRTREGAGEGAGQGESRRRSPERSRDDQRGNPQPSRVAADEWNDTDPAETWGDDAESLKGLNDGEDEEFHAKTAGDDWPDRFTPENLGKAEMSSLLAAHLTANGGKVKTRTYDIIERITGDRNFANAAENDYDALARALLHDTARFKFGLVKPAS